QNITYMTFDADAATVFDRVLAKRHVRDVLEFVAVLRVTGQTSAAPAARKSTLDLDGGGAVQRILIIVFANELKARFVDRASAEGLRVTQLKSVLGLERAVADGWQIEDPNTVTILVIPPILVARGESVSRRNLIIEPLAEIGARARVWRSVRELRDLKSRGIDEGCVHDIQFVEVAPFDVCKKGGLFAKRSADISAKLRGVISWLRR